VCSKSFGGLWEFVYKTNMSTLLLNETTPAERIHIRLLHMDDVAQRLGVSLQRAYEMGRQGILPIVRMGRQMRVEEHVLIEWIESGGKMLPATPPRNGKKSS
jgi:excisionase family DNA binding protein